jgi:hypothetical protein
MKIQNLFDQGRSSIEQLHSHLEEMQQKLSSQSIFNNNPLALPQDTFEKAPEVPAAEEVAGEGVEGGSDKLNISFQFDLYYELSQKVEAKMGQRGKERFYEVSSQVSETFMGNFSLSIDPVGSFMQGTDKSLDISPEVTNEFFDAVEGLADLSPEALEGFLQETEDFFGALEEKYGEAGGAFDNIKEQMQNQAKAFFQDVKGAREFAMGEESDLLEEIAPEEIEAAEGEVPEELMPEEGAKEAEKPITMLLKPGLKLGQNDYKEFLKSFFDYTKKFQQNMLRNFFDFPASSMLDKQVAQAAPETGAIDTSA